MVSFLLNLQPGQTIITSPRIQRLSFSNSICQLNLLCKIKIFFWKLILQKLLTTDKLKTVDLTIDGDCHLCHHVEETIYHLFNNCDWTKSVLLSIDPKPLNPNNSGLFSIDRLENIYKYKSWYNKLFHNLLEKLSLLLRQYGIIRIM